MEQGWEFAHRFSEQIARFLQKNERRNESIKKTSDSLNCSFLVSNLSDLLTSLIKKEGMSDLLIFFYVQKTYQKIRFIILVKFFWANPSFAHLSWVTWGIAHGRSFVMSDLSNSLTVALLTWATWAICSVTHLSWAIWANHSQSLIWFEQWENSQPCATWCVDA